MSDERARTINTLREIALALHSEQHDQAVAILGAVGPEAENGRPSAAQLSVVALESLDSWYAAHQLGNGSVRVSQADVPRAIRNVTPAIEALANKGRALRSTASLLQRNPEQAVAGAGAYMVSATLTTLATRTETDFIDVLNDLLPEQEVSEIIIPVEPAAPAAAPAQAAAAPVAEDVVEVIDETVETADVSQDDPQSRYTALVETRFMAGVKEFFQWMGESHGVTGTGLPKRADIQDVAATIGIDAEGVAKKPEEDAPVASDSDLTVAAETRPTSYVTSAQAIPELMAFWTTLQESGLVEVSSTKIQPGANAQDFGFEDFDALAAAEALVATYVQQTLTVDADAEAAAATAAFITGGDVDAANVLIPRLRQLEAMGLLSIVDGKVVLTAALTSAVTAGAQQVAA